MVTKLMEMVSEKKGDAKILLVCVDRGEGCCYEKHEIIPDKVNANEQRIYIEGEGYTLDMTDKEKYEVTYDETEEEFTIKQGNSVYYLS